MIYIYDAVASAVREYKNPLSDFDRMGLTNREATVLRPLLNTLLEAMKMELDEAKAELPSMVRRVKRNLSMLDAINDVRIEVCTWDSLEPKDMNRLAIRTDFHYYHNGKRTSSCFVLSDTNFSVTDRTKVCFL